MGYKNRKFYGPRYGRGRGWRARPGFRGRRFTSPFCDLYPDRPRGWWTMPEYHDDLIASDLTPPPAGAKWDPYGVPQTKDALSYEISLIEKQIEYLQKEIELLEEERKKLGPDK